jgi:probable phosphoglycerate mutase
MDKGMGRSASTGTSANAYAQPPRQQKPAPQAPAPRQILEGYVKDGVVHLLNGELPDGVFVKITRE